MLSKWLAQQVRHPAVYKFPVTNVTELVAPDEFMLDYLALALLLALGDPQQIRDDYKLLLKDAEDNSLSILTNYLHTHTLPDKSVMYGIGYIGNFGEVLATTFLIEFENFWFPIDKLRYREKKDWSMRLTDLCFIKRLDRTKPLVCYGEVKTITGRRNVKIAVDGHNSLVKGEARDDLTEPEVLHFITGKLIAAKKFEEATFISYIYTHNIEYDKRYDLFIVHAKEIWTEEILELLEEHPLDQRLVNFSTKVVLISQLRQLIDKAYEHSPKVAKALINSSWFGHFQVGFGNSVQSWSYRSDEKPNRDKMRCCKADKGVR